MAHFKRANRECTSDVGVHCACDGVGQCSKTKYILCGTNFVLEEHVINLSTCCDNVMLSILCGGGV